MSRTSPRVAAAALACVPCAVLAQVAPPPPPVQQPDEIIVTGTALTLTTGIAGQTVTTIDTRDIALTPATTIGDIVKLAPGVAFIQGNGPRDVGVSIRGSNARQSFGARNIQVFEDDFPVTQPDGLARFDLTDPHAYGAVDIVRGPSSARYGNFALGGAVNFRSRSGREVDGLEVGSDVGRYGYANVYATLGKAGPGYDYSIFASLVGGKGSTGHTDYRTGTINALGTFAVDGNDRIALKLIHNTGEFRLSTRLSYAQYLANPYQQGCERAATAAPGCATIQVFVNGRNGPRIAQTAAEADLARDDKRTIIGVRHEHDFSSHATLRTQGTFDRRDVYQPTSATPFRGTLNSYQLSSDLTVRSGATTGFLQVAYGSLENRSYSFAKTPAGRDGFGAPTQFVVGDVRNLAIRARGEMALTPRLLAVAGVGAERSWIDVVQTGFTYPLNTTRVVSVIPAERRFDNLAPEASLRWRAIDAVTLHARIAKGYGIPQAGGLFVTQAGIPGDNRALKSQRNTGVDLGATVALGGTLTAEATVYQEWFRNELVSQSAGVNLLAYTSNVPRSVHRGVELGLDWRPVAGLRALASYGYTDQTYRDFQERLTTGTVSRTIDRRGNAIPGVVPHFGNVRLGYDQPTGPAAGLGGFVETNVRSRYWLDNGNRLRVPGYSLVNLNLHYDPPPGDGGWRRLSYFVSVQNVADKTYVGSASIVSDSLSAAGVENGAAVLRNVGSALYAGQPRTWFAGIKARFQ
ncbi:TonB-dependent receptor [Microvirga sp. SRT01]|uniref:TonB-dependent receptor n=1 Tax=Sphingomonas longa TaxID=2778730 RepID=A0ABS2DAE8_9SPHN|nr:MULTISPECIES: TonB-dependent receptor [Alphaproteobacteria]MBM6577917.1 TonB-dependent receptor [Sphingomonas sp. BT552]MBR7710958.1 TonB-dependent receptor [Microvirga sp. SRT01]